MKLVLIETLIETPKMELYVHSLITMDLLNLYFA